MPRGSRIPGSSFSDYLQAKHSQRRARIGDNKASLFCPACRHSHPYVGSTHPGSNNQRLLIAYDKRGEANVLLWKCPLTGDILKETYLGDTRVVRSDVDQQSETTD